MSLFKGSIGQNRFFGLRMDCSGLPCSRASVQSLKPAIWPPWTNRQRSVWIE